MKLKYKLALLSMVIDSNNNGTESIIEFSAFIFQDIEHVSSRRIIP